MAEPTILRHFHATNLNGCKLHGRGFEFEWLVSSFSNSFIVVVLILNKNIKILKHNMISLRIANSNHKYMIYTIFKNTNNKSLLIFVVILL